MRSHVMYGGLSYIIFAKCALFMSSIFYKTQSEMVFSQKINFHVIIDIVLKNKDTHKSLHE